MEEIMNKAIQDIKEILENRNKNEELIKTIDQEIQAKVNESFKYNNKMSTMDKENEEYKELGDKKELNDKSMDELEQKKEELKLQWVKGLASVRNELNTEIEAEKARIKALDEKIENIRTRIHENDSIRNWNIMFEDAEFEEEDTKKMVEELKPLLEEKENREKGLKDIQDFANSISVDNIDELSKRVMPKEPEKKEVEKKEPEKKEPEKKEPEKKEPEKKEPEKKEPEKKEPEKKEPEKKEPEKKEPEKKEPKKKEPEKKEPEKKEPEKKESEKKEPEKKEPEKKEPEKKEPEKKEPEKKEPEKKEPEKKEPEKKEIEAKPKNPIWKNIKNAILKGVNVTRNFMVRTGNGIKNFVFKKVPLMLGTGAKETFKLGYKTGKHTIKGVKTLGKGAKFVGSKISQATKSVGNKISEATKDIREEANIEMAAKQQAKAIKDKNPRESLGMQHFEINHEEAIKKSEEKSGEEKEPEQLENN